MARETALMYERYEILLDTAASRPGLGFGEAALALGELVLNSPPQFAVGIFGVWGSGKTTLMRAIEHRVAAEASAVPIWFNAWRYEREEHLIVPMLDTLREALLAWAMAHPADPAATEGKARKAASMVAKAARAIVAGLALKGRLIGVEASFDASKALTAWQRDATKEDDSLADDPQSFYHASFRALEAAMKDFVGEHGERRIIVFIDDLDRCLPENALEVLESTKLFFDLPGFVFVVGLDHGVIERAVAAKYSNSPSADGRTPVPGTDYVKKIFQVQFAVPRVVEEQLERFVAVIAEGLPPDQAADIRDRATPHLRFLTIDGSVNPREVKRYLNDYTVQLRMLEKKLGSVGEPNADVVLTLLTMSFHADWRTLYDHLVLDPDEFQLKCVDALSRPAATRTLQLGGRQLPLPEALVRYLRNEGRSLLEESLEVYVSSVEAIGSTDSTVIEAKRALRDVHGTLAVEGGPPEQLQEAISRLYRLVRETVRSEAGEEAARRAGELRDKAIKVSGAASPDARERSRLEIVEVLETIEDYLNDARRRATTGSGAFA
jgi:hypothetical protein